MVAAKAVEELLGAAVDIVERSARSERRDAELANLIAVADGIVGRSASAPQLIWTQNPPFTQTCAGGA